MTGITQAAFARQHSVSRAAVAKWKIGGYINMVDGLVDVEASDARLRDFGLGRFNPQPSPRLGGVNRQPRATIRRSSTRANTQLHHWSRC